MYVRYSFSGKTRKIAFIVIPAVTFLVFSMLTYPLAYIFLLINIKNNIPTFIGFVAALLFGAIFCLCTIWPIKISHCRNRKISLLLSATGMTLGFYFFICFFIVLGSNYSAHKILSFDLDLFLTVFRFIYIFTPIVTDSDIGMVVGLKIAVNYLVILFSIVIFNLYLFNIPYSEEDGQWMKYKHFRKILGGKVNLDLLAKRLNNYQFDLLDEITLKDTNKKPSSESNILQFNVFTSKNVKEIVASAVLNYTSYGSKGSKILLSDAYIRSPYSISLSKYLNI